MIVILWIVFSICVGLCASNHRNRSGFLWGLLSLFISPLIAVVILLCSSTIVENTPVKATSEEDFCSSCRSKLVMIEGNKKCTYCGKN